MSNLTKHRSYQQQVQLLLSEKKDNAAALSTKQYFKHKELELNFEYSVMMMIVFQVFAGKIRLVWKHRMDIFQCLNSHLVLKD